MSEVEINNAEAKESSRAEEKKLTTVIIEFLTDIIENQKSSNSRLKVYDNNGIKQLLGIKDRLLQKYRNEGYLSYSQVNDKFWYTEEDIIKFLANSHREAFAYS